MAGLNQKYVKVVNSEILAGPMYLPENYVNPNKTVDTNLQNLSDAALEELGWLRWIEVNAPIYDDPFYTTPSISTVFYSDRVEATYVNNKVNLNEAISIRSDQVNKKRDEVLEAGFFYNGYLYQSDDKAWQNMTGTMSLVATGAPLPENFTWRTLDNINIPYDNYTFTMFYSSAMTWVNTIYNVAWYHKAQISSLTDVDSVIAYDIDVGWP